jgi:hypothetical protein
MVRNANVYNKHVKKHMKEYNYMKTLRALREGRNTNPAHKDALNSLTSDSKEKNPYWDRKSVDDQNLTAKAPFTEKNPDQLQNHYGTACKITKGVV